MQRDRPAEALPLFDKAIALAPDFFEARLNKAIAMQLGGDRAGAIREYESLLRDAGSRPELASQRAAAAQLLAKLRR